MPESNDDAKRRILTLVAEGQLSPGEAAEQLAALDAPTGTGPSGSAEDDPDPEVDLAGTGPSRKTAPPSPGTGPVRRVKIAATARSVIVQADPTVREAIAQGGRYEQHYEGDTLVISSEIDWEDEDGFGGFRVHRVPGGFAGRDTARIVINGRKGFDRAKAMMRETLVVRMHPDLALTAEVAAGSLNVTGVRGPVTANVAAGSMKIDGFCGPLVVDVAAGSFKGSGRLDSGKSKIGCAMGSVKLDLDRQSSVRIDAEASLGSIKLPGRSVKSDKGGFGMQETQESVLGDGRGSLKVEASMGSVKISLDDD